METRPRTVFEIRVPKDNEYTPENSASFLASLVGGDRHGIFKRLLRRSHKSALSLEIVTHDQRTHFQLVVPTEHAPYFESQILAQYPTSLLTRIDDPLQQILYPPPPSRRTSAS